MFDFNTPVYNKTETVNEFNNYILKMYAVNTRNLFPRALKLYFFFFLFVLYLYCDNILEIYYCTLKIWGGFLIYSKTTTPVDVLTYFVRIKSSVEYEYFLSLFLYTF